MATTMEEKRLRRHIAYRLVASRDRLSPDPDDDAGLLFRYLLSPQQSIVGKQRELQQVVLQAKTDLLRSLAQSGGDVAQGGANQAVQQLGRIFESSHFDVSKVAHHDTESRRSPFARDQSPVQIEGVWFDISKPMFPDCLGQTSKLDCLRENTLGRMSFDNVAPGDLVLSIQANFNPIQVVDEKDLPSVPAFLQKELQKHKDQGSSSTVLRKYDITTVFTIEPSRKVRSNIRVKRPIEGLMTTYGFEISDPALRLDRLNTWFIGGTLECISANQPDWHLLFGDVHRRTHQHRIGGKQSGLQADGSISYSLPQPVSNGAYMDIVYLDETLRIVRISGDRVYVSARVPYPDE